MLIYNKCLKAPPSIPKNVLKVLSSTSTQVLAPCLNITDNQTLPAPQHQLCNLSIIFSNNAGQSDPLIRTLSKR